MSIVVTSEMLQRRTMRGGVYDTIINAKIGNNVSSLARVDPGIHFHKVSAGFKDSEKFIGTDKHDFVFNYIGEIAPGFVAHPIGSYMSNGDQNFVPVTDSNRIKHNIPIVVPTNSPPRINAIFHNQVATLTNAIAADEQNARVGPIKPCTKSSNMNGIDDTIITVTKPLYQVPKDKRSSSTKVNIDDDEPAASSGSSIQLNNQPTIINARVGDMYPCTTLAGYGGPCFNHVSSKTVQLNIRDPEGNLVPPQDTYRWLVPGALILVHATLHIYHMNRTSYYQLTASSIQIIDKGDIIPPVPTVLELPSRNGNVLNSSNVDRSTVVNFTGLMNGNASSTETSSTSAAGPSQAKRSFDVLVELDEQDVHLDYSDDIEMGVPDEKQKKASGKKAKKGGI
ncbi:hypothetical protein EV361DRAFT_869195 [Lentinula raphanica]|uniref:Uncharacterized protein n=1 Tax=Lentinula raphanica TaxID=153919 RepID=A0AA38PC05_9AGAR|nr:hypothetical protein F5878DRAFT_640624 [Lentinula raphanica]KAJ3970540.1 hypothetical protein EV361DRAFT_869195 [Lentinula raphanica]